MIRGTNPMRWNCEKDGCFNTKKRPKIEVFKPCFPRAINFGDVDGMVEYRGSALFLEWKPTPDELKAGQLIAYRNLSRNGLVTVYCCAGDAETMDVTHVRYFWKRKETAWKAGGLEDAMKFFRGWVKWVDEIHEFVADYQREESRLEAKTSEPKHAS